ncbi:hypothetical protein [uncultured Senegalimassilia sp.]|nr:hypothetical protein [uncultured Senegalimassilia sp.]
MSNEPANPNMPAMSKSTRGEHTACNDWRNTSINSNAAAAEKSVVSESEFTASPLTSDADIHTPLRISAVHAKHGPKPLNLQIKCSTSEQWTSYGVQ